MSCALVFERIGFTAWHFAPGTRLGNSRCNKAANPLFLLVFGLRLTPMPNLPPGQGKGLDFHPCAGGSQVHEHLPRCLTRGRAKDGCRKPIAGGRLLLRVLAERRDRLRSTFSLTPYHNQIGAVEQKLRAAIDN